MLLITFGCLLFPICLYSPPHSRPRIMIALPLQQSASDPTQACQASDTCMDSSFRSHLRCYHPSLTLLAHKGHPLALLQRSVDRLVCSGVSLLEHPIGLYAFTSIDLVGMKKSSAPPSGLINPSLFSSWYHLTVPC